MVGACVSGKLRACEMRSLSPRWNWRLLVIGKESLSASATGLASRGNYLLLKLQSGSNPYKNQPEYRLYIIKTIAGQVRYTVKPHYSQFYLPKVSLPLLPSALSQLDRKPTKIVLYMKNPKHLLCLIILNGLQYQKLSADTATIPQTFSLSISFLIKSVKKIRKCKLNKTWLKPDWKSLINFT